MSLVGNIPKLLVQASWLASAVILSCLVLHMPSAGEVEYGTDTLFRMTSFLFLSVLPLVAFRPAAIRWSVADLLLLGSAVLYMVSAFAGGRKISFVVLQEVFPYLLLYFSVKVFAGTGRVYSQRFFMLLFCISLGAEAMFGLLQVFGYESSGHAVFGMTGSFRNPGPFGGYVAILMSVAVVPVLRFVIGKAGDCGFVHWSVKALLFVPAAVLFLGMTVLPASQSRAGWLAFGTAVLLFAFAEGNLRTWIRKHVLGTLLVSVAAMVLSVGIFCLKRDSALGRLHIWNIELRAIASAPILGTGPGTALGAYGEAQEHFYRTHIDKIGTLGVAGCPEYAFNEFLKVGMETGIAGLLVVLSAVVVAVVFLLRERNAFAYGLAAAVVFSMFSYPLSIVRISVIIVIMLAVAGCRRCLPPVLPFAVSIILSFGVSMLKDVYQERLEAVSDWSDARHWSGMEMYEESVEELSKLYDKMFWNYRYLYDYGYTLHKLGRYEESNAVLQEGAGISSDPMFHNVMGKNFEGLGEFAQAEYEYMTAHYMVPGRLYPLVLLMEMYYSRGETNDALELGERILKMPVNEKNAAMKDLHERVSDNLQKWENRNVCIDVL